MERQSNLHVRLEYTRAPSYSSCSSHFVEALESTILSTAKPCVWLHLAATANRAGPLRALTPLLLYLIPYQRGVVYTKSVLPLASCQL
jgi:hypothetical protein